MANDYKVLKAIFIDWLKLPGRAAKVAAGEPPTVVEWAKLHNVRRETLQRWKNDPEVKKAVATETLGLLSVDDVQRIILALKERAFDGNVQSCKLLLDLSGLAASGGLNPGDQSGEVSLDELTEMSDAELDRMLEDEADE